MIFFWELLGKWGWTGRIFMSGGQSLFKVWHSTEKKAMEIKAYIETPSIPIRVSKRV